MQKFIYIALCSKLQTYIILKLFDRLIFYLGLQGKMERSQRKLFIRKYNYDLSLIIK